MNSGGNQFLDIFNSIDFNSIVDHPNILIAARFWEDERYDAARVCYKLMRSIDDLIDNYKADNKVIAPGERTRFAGDVNGWLEKIRASAVNDPLVKGLSECMDKFRIPIWPLETFAKSMLYDIDHDGFATMYDFLEYSQGASVAPASIFVHLNSISKKNGKFELPSFDVREAATPCAIFSYLVHIIRDFQKDQLNNLNYFADDLIKKNNLSRKELRSFSEGRPVSEGFRNMVKEYYSLADEYRVKTLRTIERISPFLEPRYQLSLHIIFSLYEMVFERIDVANGSFTTEDLNPTPEETRERVYQTIVRFIKNSNR
ncbi:MAG: squalene/phytoene synthase family protein [Bacteroidales bacterium]|jgi:phytoene/squalene synthetase|nr:squalene/phytoene synthase family protein [Bacteroidales bacterium]